MKKQLIYFLLIISFAAFLGCESDNELGFNESSQGFNFRMMRNVASFNSLAANTVDQEVVLTMFSESNNIDNVTILVDFFQFSTKSTTNRGVLATIDGSTLKNDGSSKITLKLNDFLTATGVDFNDLAGGDVFNIYNVVELANGRVYPDTILIDTDGDGDLDPILNIDNNASVETSNYVATLSFPIVCPVSLPFEGTYSITDDQGFWVGDVEVTSDGGPKRAFTGNWGDAIGLSFDGIGFTFDLVCGSIFVPEQSIGLGCGAAGNVNVVTSVDLGPGSYDDTDDSEFTIHVYYTNPNCLGGFNSTLNFVKQ